VILTGQAIARGVTDGTIVIEPFEPSQVGPNSYDFRLGDRCKIYESEILDSRRENKAIEIPFPSEGLLLAPNRLYLFNTFEMMGSSCFVPIIRGRSSVGRLGLFIHITADLIDIGSINQWTLQLHCVQPIRVFPGMLVGQVTFWVVEGDVQLYKGKYANHMSPVPSLIHMDQRG
jgi:dCTP deaminase